mgnify:FL=1|jgi:hypothetical protein
MSKYFFERLEQGYAGEKDLKIYFTNGDVHDKARKKCSVSYCNNVETKYKGVGSTLCETHQARLREYGGPARMDRPWTFNKKRCCDLCGHDPWKHPKVKLIDDELIRDRVAWGMLFVDHIETQRDGGSHCDQNTQTLCLDCNMIKSTLAGDMVPKKLYKDENEYHSVLERLEPHFNKVFND